MKTLLLAIAAIALVGCEFFRDSGSPTYPEAPAGDSVEIDSTLVDSL